MKTSLKLLVVPLAMGALLVGCGGDDSSDDSTSSDTSTTQTQPADTNATGNNADAGKAQVLTLAADPSGALAYDTTELTAKPGKVTVDFTNDSPVPHDVVIEDAAGEKAAAPVITGESASTEFDAKPGDYTFYCSVPGHEQGGMKGTLKVE